MELIGNPTSPCLSPFPSDPIKFCVGQTRVNFGSWYVPNGKKSEEFTYCEYCISQGCASMDEVYKASGNPWNTNCDCIKQKDHPLFKTLECPTCKVKKIGMCRIACCGMCSKCKADTPYSGQKYCPGCSWTLKTCHECGEEIREGNSYLEGIRKVIDKHIKRTQNYRVGEENIQSYIAGYNQKYDGISKKISGKTKEEMINFLSVKVPEKIVLEKEEKEIDETKQGRK